MALLPILRYPDPRLKKVAQPVAKIDDTIRKLAADMAETMYEAPGIGLAATQVDVHLQLVVIDISEDKSGLITLINPRIVERDGEQVYEEGCLSVPGIYDKVTRACLASLFLIRPCLSCDRWSTKTLPLRWSSSCWTHTASRPSAVNEQVLPSRSW